jgi:hypothetical protein
MDVYAQTGLGILVSIVLFLFGYRQTIGARKERVRAANNTVHRALVRRMVLENYQPKYDDISRILEGKAREFQVSADDLYSEEQVLNQLFTEVFDNDLIAPAQRTEIETRLEDVFRQLLTRKDELEKPTQQLALPAKDQKDRLIWLMGLATSMAGAVTAFLLIVRKEGTLISDNAISDISDIKLLIPVAGVFLGSIAAVTAISVLKRSREAPEEPSKKVAIHEGIELEQEIAAVLDKAGVSYEIQPSSGGILTPDFLVKLNDRRIAIEAKAWRSPPPLRLLSMTRDRAKLLLDRKVADEVVIVTNLKSPLPQTFTHVEGIKILPVKELPTFLNRRAA